MKLTAARLGTLVWASIYGGLIAAAIGVALARSGETYGVGVGVVVAGAVLVAIGAVLVWVRSRRPEP